MILVEIEQAKLSDVENVFVQAIRKYNRSNPKIKKDLLDNIRDSRKRKVIENYST